MQKKIVVATSNKHKIVEIASYLQNTKIELLSLYDVGIFSFPIDEYGRTFRMNSYIKAFEVFSQLRLPVLSDDSGLVVPELSGEPGIFSARYSGKNGTDSANCKKLIERISLRKLIHPRAYFVCIITFFSKGYRFQVAGRCYGHIAKEEKGKKGFGYDPVFIPLGYKKHMGELDREVKNKIGHRGKALRELVKGLKTLNII